jgi:hypothetical protein
MIREDHRLLVFEKDANWNKLFDLRERKEQGMEKDAEAS